MLLLLVLGLASFAFVAVGQAGGFANIQTGGLSVVIVVVAVLGAIATPFTAFGLRWGTDVVHEIPSEARQGIGEHSLEMFGCWSPSLSPTPWPPI